MTARARYASAVIVVLWAVLWFVISRDLAALLPGGAR